ncbi:MAG: DUF1858 domain-containing protein [Oscillospiraceae bacterium]|nr:DUF1858 domain-containing protein [Oscillospiraceae bacterium]MBR0450589.1 DUF1858 domain-containing protein [Oscillospiraceae bacterium]MDO5136836.1 DUF1858 domain-containing protein [Oscillospiraceae bacterium]
MKNKTVFVTGEDVITEMITKYPEAEKVLIESGMHCLGCFSAGFETLREACLVHGLDPVEILEKVNSALEEARS